MPRFSAAAAPDVASAFSQALAFHQTGHLAEAEQLYRTILAAQPRHFDSLHLLGVIHYQRGQHDEAVRHIDRALKINPGLAIAHNNRGVALAELKRFDEALASYERAAALVPDYADAFFNRGNALKELKRFDHALVSYEKVIALKPDYAEALNKRGNVLNELGRVDEAVASYDRAIALKPDYSEAYNNRGVTLAKLTRFDEALASYDAAVALRPADAEVLNNRGLALAELGRFDEAVASYDKAIALKTDYTDAFYNRGLALARLKRFDEALVSYDQAIALRPDHVDAFNSRGVALVQLDRLDDAVASYDRALALKPGYPEAFNNRGNALHDLKRFDEAVTSYERAIALRPDYAEALYNRGNALNGLKRLEEALASYDRALALNPDYADALNNRGVALNELGRWDEALKSYDRALGLKLDYADAFNNRGNALKDLKRFDEALASYHKAIALRPEHAEYFNNLAIVLADLKRFDEALANYDRAIALKPEYAEAHSNRGFALREMRRLEEARASFGKALAIKPDLDYLRGIHFHAKMHLCDWTGFAEDCAELDSAVAKGAAAALPFQLLATPSGPAHQLKCAATYGSDKYSGSRIPLWRDERYAHARIRVAYLSADLRDHPVAHLSAGLFERHDRKRFETIAISFKSDGDHVLRERLRASFDRFIDAERMSDSEVARLLRELEIDIAVDLNGFTEGSRPHVFALRPAPIQVNYLGYAGTLGQSHWDYILADRFVVPEQSGAQYAEKVVYLPDTFMVTDGGRRMPDRMPSRAAAGLPDNGLVFCCFNNSFKITPHVFDIWMRVLREVGDSVLWLSATNATAVSNLRREAQARGVAADRLVFAPRLPLIQDHLARLGLADLFLDTLYYNAHATAADALWAGVPVLTCAGETFASRVAGSLLGAVGLPEVITYSPEDYEALALRLARNSAFLTDIKHKLARNRAAYPLFDTERFTRHLESAYTAMWERYQRGESPRGFAVTLGRE